MTRSAFPISNSIDVAISTETGWDTWVQQYLQAALNERVVVRVERDPYSWDTIVHVRAGEFYYQQVIAREDDDQTGGEMRERMAYVARNIAMKITEERGRSRWREGTNEEPRPARVPLPVSFPAPPLLQQDITPKPKEKPKDSGARVVVGDEAKRFSNLEFD